MYLQVKICEAVLQTNHNYNRFKFNTYYQSQAAGNLMPYKG